MNKAKSTTAILQMLNRMKATNYRLVSIDPSPAAAKWWPLLAGKFRGRVEAELVDYPSQEVKPTALVPEGVAWMLIDGCHCYECVLEDIDRWCPAVVPGGVVVFHDHDFRPCYTKRNICFRSGIVRRWGVAPAIWMSEKRHRLHGLRPLHIVPGRGDGLGLGIYEKQ